MKQCRIVTLYSGSGGNATYVKVGNTAILIDAGKSARRVCEGLREIGSDISEIRGIFVTHDHNDHVSALEILAKKHGIPVHMTEGSAALFDRDPASPIHRSLVRHETRYREIVGEVEVCSFRTPHDSRMSVGYRLEFEDGERRRAFGVATDIGTVTDELRSGLLGCEAVVLESNHDVEMLMKGPYPYELKKRIRSGRGHLSNADSAALASELWQSGTKAFLLAHLSEENNDPTLALEEATCAISDPRAVILTADPEIPVELPIPKEKERSDAELEIDNPWHLEGGVLERSGGGI